MRSRWSDWVTRSALHGVRLAIFYSFAEVPRMKIALLICSMGIFVCGLASTGAQGDPRKPRATLELEVPDQVSGLSRYEGAYEVILRNDGSSGSIWVNGRMLERGAGHPDLSTGLAELAVDIVGPLGPVPFDCMDKRSTLFATANDYVLLKPGEKIVRKRGLFCFGLDAAGHYTARARTHPRREHDPRDPPTRETCGRTRSPCCLRPHWPPRA
jgi:hypothetical protein